MENELVSPSIVKYNDIGKSEIMFQLSKQPGKVFPFYPPTEVIPAQSEILFIPEKLDDKGNKTGEADMENATNRLIAYVPGMRSIFVDEWSDKEKDNLKKLESIKFTNGFKTVSVREVTLLFYLRTAGYCKSNDSTRISPSVLYREVNYEAEAKKVVDLDNKLINAQYFVNNNPIDEVRAYAEALCKTQGEVEEIRSQGENTVRYKLKDLARTSPELFVSGLSDPIMKNKLFIVRALQKDIIGCDSKDTEMYWTNSNEVFIQAPSGMSVIPYFAELSSKNEKYGKLLDSIKLMIDNNVKAPEKLDWISTFINQAISEGGLIKSNNWYLVPGEDEDAEPLMKFNGTNKLRAAIESGKDNIMGMISLSMKRQSEQA